MLRKTFIIISAVIVVSTSSLAQVRSIDELFANAARNSKLVLLKFYADWCEPCGTIEKKVFNSPEFVSFEREKLISLTINFPQKQDTRSASGMTQRDKDLIEKYNPGHMLPYIVLTDSRGNVLQKWSGYPRNLRIEDYIAEIKNFIR